MSNPKRTYNRTNPAQIRPSLELADRYAKAGIQFVPMPVFSDEEARDVALKASQRLAGVEKEIAAEEREEAKRRAEGENT